MNLAEPPVAYPGDILAQTAFESGWHHRTAKNLASELETARAELAKLRSRVLDAITLLEDGEDPDAVHALLAEATS